MLKVVRPIWGWSVSCVNFVSLRRAVMTAFLPEVRIHRGERHIYDKPVGVRINNPEFPSCGFWACQIQDFGDNEV